MDDISGEERVPGLVILGTASSSECKIARY